MQVYFCAIWQQMHESTVIECEDINNEPTAQRGWFSKKTLKHF
jgi:hypothetical protein